MPCPPGARPGDGVIAHLVRVPSFSLLVTGVPSFFVLSSALHRKLGLDFSLSMSVFLEWELKDPMA